MIEKKPFRRYNVDSEPRDQVVLRISPELRRIIDEHRSILQEPKQATIIKQLVVIGANALQTPLSMAIRSTFFKNKRRNDRYEWTEIE